MKKILLTAAAIVVMALAVFFDSLGSAIESADGSSWYARPPIPTTTPPVEAE